MIDRIQEIERIIKRNEESVQKIYNEIRGREYAEKENARAMRGLEEKKYREFKKLAERDQYFSLDHVDRLDLAYDILLVVSEKNIGKTTAIYKKMKQAKAEGFKSIFMRMTLKEVESCMQHFNLDKLSPFYAAKCESLFYFYDKEEYHEIVEQTITKDKGDIVKINFGQANKLGLKPWGFATSFRACNTLAGGSFENYKYIFIDEFISWNTFKMFNAGTWENWAAFPSSIARNKKEMQIYMFGNLKASNCEILDYYGIKQTDKLRYIHRGFRMCSKHKKKFNYEWKKECDKCSDCEPPCKILYINADRIYEGVKNQHVIVKQASAKEYHTTLLNRVISSSDRVLPQTMVEEFDEIVGYVAFESEYGNLTDASGGAVVFELRRISVKNFLNEKSIYLVRGRPLEGYLKFELPILTESKYIMNKYRNVKFIPSIYPKIFPMWLHYKERKLYFVHDRDILIWNDLMDRFENNWELISEGKKNISTNYV